MKSALCLVPGLCLALALPRVARADLGYDKKANGGFVTALLRDGNELWSGTEDAGVAHLQAGKWTHYTTKDGLGDNDAYALAHDRLGRVWVGHLNHGVSVWNGNAWKNYGVADGPLGERVFAIATSPVDGDVWIAHNAGLTRYSLQSNTWTHYTRATGLPTIEIGSLAFDALGRLWVGTQHGGLLRGAPDDDFGSWQQIKGASASPLVPQGEGLPSNFINDVLVTPEDKIFVATDTGLAQSDNYGESWTFLRGRDWLDKAKGLWKGPKVEAPEVQLKELLAEDYVTNLAQDDRGLLWIGYRRAGYEVRRPLVDRAPFLYPEDKGGDFPYISSIVPLGDGTAALGFYNDGVKQSIAVPPYAATPAEREALVRRERPTIAAPRVGIAPLPSVASAPSAAELNHLLELVKARPTTPDGAPPIAVLPADWTTQGDWRGRYGRYWASLSALLAPYNYNWGAGREPIDFVAKIGPNAARDDGMRYWVHTLYTDDRRALEMPTIYFHSRLVKGLTPWADDPAKQKYRRQSEWDDHGEEYPLSKDGPDLYVALKIPAGNYVLSLYNRNKDGHEGFNRARDYNISVRPHDSQKALSEIEDFGQRPNWAQTRQRDFWGGEWKKFAVRGPQNFTVKVGRNYSFNTILAGVFLDEINEEPQPYFDAPANSAQTASWKAANEKPADEAAEQLWAALQDAKSADVLWWSSQSRLFYQALLRHYQTATTRTASPEMPALWSRLGTCSYQLNLYPEWEAMQQRRGLKTARAIEKSLEWDEKSSFNGQGARAIVAARTQKRPSAR